MRVVRNAIHGIDDEGFEKRRAEIAELGPFRRVHSIRMADERFANLVRQVQTREFGIAFFEFIDAAKAVKIVVETAVVEQAGMQRVLARVSEGGMADVVGKGNRFGEVFVQPKPTGHGTGDLGDFERVRESSSVMVVDRRDEDLRLPRHPSKRRGVYDPLAVPLKGRAERMRRLVVPSASAREIGEGVGGKVTHVRYDKRSS